MRKKLILRSIGLVFLGLIILLAYQYIRLPFLFANGLEAIPNNTPVILRFNHLEETREKLKRKVYSKDLSEIFLVEKLGVELDQLQQLFKRSKAQHKVIEEGRKTVALRVSSSNELDFLYVIDAFENPFKLSEFVKQIGQPGAEVSIFKKHRIYSLKLSDSQGFSIAHCYGVILFAKYPLLIEEAIAQLKNKHNNLAHDASFKIAKRNLSTEKDLNVFFNFEDFPFLFSTFVKLDKRKIASQIKNYASWVRLDLEFEENGISTSGTLVPPVKTPLLQILRKQKNGNHREVADVLPDNTALLHWLNVKDWRAFLKGKEEGRIANFSKYFMPWLGDEVATLMTEPYSSSLQSEKFLLFKAKDIAFAEHYLEKFTEESGLLQSFDYQTYKVSQVMANDLLKPVLDQWINPVQNPFYTTIGNYVVFANSRSALEIWIDKYIVGQTLGRDINYLKFSTKLSSDANSFLFVNTSNLQQIMNAFTKEALQVSLKKEFNAYKKVSLLGFELTPSWKKFNFSGHFQYSPTPKKASSYAWKTSLVEDAAIPPNIIINPESGKKEILIQDKNNFLYRINTNGEIVWRKSLLSKILSPIKQIDPLKNGAPIFVFNTSTHLHQINDKGEPLPSFPIHLLSPATNSMTVVDFANRKEYAFYLACENGNVYGFDVKGRPLAGWNPLANIGTVTHPILHFQKGPNDFFVIQNDGGQLNCFKRNGTKRFDLKISKDGYLSGPDFQSSGVSSRIVTADTKGKIYVSSLSGNDFQLGWDVGDNEAIRFSFMDVLGDVRKDYVGLNGNTLACYGYEDNQFIKAFDYQFDASQSDLFSISLSEENKNYIGTLCEDKKQINLLNNNGMLCQDFPLAGTTRFEIVDFFDEKKNTLLVANGKEVYAYRLR